MRYEKTMDSARSLIGDRKFADAAKICEDLIRNQTEEAEASVLAAACLLCLGCTEKEAKKQEKVRRAVLRALGHAETEEALEKTEERLRSAMERYRAEQLEAGLRKQKEKASLPELKLYFDILERYRSLPKLLADAAAEARKNLGISTENQTELPEDSRAEQLGQAEYETARSVFGEAKVLVRFHGSGSSAEVSETLRRSIEMLTVAQVLASRSGAAPCTPQEQAQRLRTEAEVLYFGLTGMLHPDGQSLSLYCSGREEMIAQLRELYSRIPALDPEFCPPELPSPEAVNTVPQKPGLLGKRKKK